MTNPAHDLSKLRIDRDAPPLVKAAFRRAAIIAGGAVAIIVLVLGFLAWPRRMA